MSGTTCADLGVYRRSTDSAVAQWALAVSVAAAISAGFVWSNHGAPSPATWWAAAFLFLLIEEDVRRRRIPNWLTLPGLAIALILGVWAGGWSGGAWALAGAATALALLFPVFLLRWMGAGDAKALMALGALWGPLTLLGCLWWMLVAGGLMALAAAGIRGGLGDIARRWASSLWTSLLTRRWVYFAPEPGSAALAGVPFGVAIGVGSTAYQLWGLPWS